MRTKIIIFGGSSRDKSKRNLNNDHNISIPWLTTGLFDRRDFHLFSPFLSFSFQQDLDSLPMTRVARVDRAITGPVGSDFAGGTGDHHRSSVGAGYRRGSRMRPRKHGAMGCWSCENCTMRRRTCYHRSVATKSRVLRVSRVTVSRTGVPDTWNTSCSFVRNKVNI